MELVFGPGALTGDTGGSLRRLLGMNETFYDQVYGKFKEHDAWGLVPILLRPLSRGRVKLRSANPFQAPMFYAGYLTDKRDRETLIEGIKQVIIVITIIIVVSKLIMTIIIYNLNNLNKINNGRKNNNNIIYRYVI